MIEKWVDIKGYENKYAISNFGRIKSIKANLIMKPMKCTNGYLCACLWKNNRQKKILVHRLVALHFISNPENYEDVNHIDENKENNRVDNLQWCSHSFNMNYGNVKIKIGNANRGKKAHMFTKAKLSAVTRNRTWIHNDTEEKLIHKNELQKFKNYTMGRLK